VPRAVALASPAEAVEEADRMLASCLLVDVSDRLLRDARALASRQIRTLDAIHLATALYVEADELIAYDRRLLAGGASHGLRSNAPGLA
jgi:predicted nucleic acid-binding protein